MRWSFHHLRIRALQVLTRTVKPSLPLGGYLLQSLAFASPSEAARFITACGGVLVEVGAGEGSSSGGGGAAGAAGGAGAGEGGGSELALPPPPPPPLPAPEFRLVLDCKASCIEMVREVTKEEEVFRGAGLVDYLKAAVAVAAAPQ